MDKTNHEDTETNRLLKILIEKADKNEKLVKETQEKIEAAQRVAIENSKGIEDIKKNWLINLFFKDHSGKR